MTCFGNLEMPSPPVPLKINTHLLMVWTNAAGQNRKSIFCPLSFQIK